MENVHARPGLFHKIVSFAILGFLLILFSGPLMTLLTFASIGFAGWVLYRAFTLGKDVAWEDIKKASSAVWQGVIYAAGWVCGWTGDAAHTVQQRFWPRLKSRAVAVVDFVKSSTGHFLQIVIEAASAAVIGGLLGGVITSGPRFSEESVIVGGVIGAAVGALYGIRMGRPVKAASQHARNS